MEEELAAAQGAARLEGRSQSDLRRRLALEELELTERRR
jgi:hypothetical protein